MEALVGLFLMLLGVSHGVETSCDARQNGTQCYGALGGTVGLQLMDSASEIFRYSLRKNPLLTEILSGRNDRILTNVIESRSSFTPSNGTFRINELSMTDGGEYELITFNSNGQSSEQRTLQLTIQAPVSSVLLVPECLSQGEMKVSCFSEGGDSPQYSWTLDGHSLTDAELLSGTTQTHSITLKQHVSGQLVCSVRNSVSEVVKEKVISTCGFIFINCTSTNGTHIAQWVFEANNTLQCIEPTTTQATNTGTSTVDNSLLICGVRAAVVILALIVITVYFAWKKNKREKAVDSAVRSQLEHQENSVVMVEYIQNICVETSCDARQNGAQCYGALGGTVGLQLMDSALEIFRLSLRKNPIEILNWRKDRILTNVIESRSSFTPSNGTFRINELSRTDGGEYELETFNSNGQISEQRTLQLTIQAPVSSVLLVPECLSQGEMKVSCFSEGGDSPQYSWTLDGQSLTDAELLSGTTQTNSITLKQHVSGQLVCSVRNSVSRKTSCGFTLLNCTFSDAIHVSRWVLSGNNSLCETTTTTLTESEASTVDNSLLICGVRAAVVILALIVITVYFAWKKNKREKAVDSAVRSQLEHQENSVVMVEM